MRKQYDDFVQMKIDEMSRTMSDITYKYINPETKEPTKVPATHYKEQLDRNVEIFLSETVKRNMLLIVYNQLASLKDENEKYFNEALLCMDLKINPKKLSINEAVALDYTYEHMQEKQIEMKKDKNGYHFLDADLVNTFNKAKDDPILQAQVIRESNQVEKSENEPLNSNNYYNDYHDYNNLER